MATLIVGTGLGEFTTIQAAVNAAANGDTILVRTGTYVEQVTVDAKNNLTIKAFNASAVVEIVAPSVIEVNGIASSSGPSTGPVRAVVAVNNSLNFKLENIRVDGAFAGDTTPGSNGDEIAGVALLESSGSLKNVTIENVGNSPEGGLFGLQHGVGLLIDGGPGAPNLAVQVTGSTITDYQKNGAIVTGVKLTFTGNAIEGIGATALTAQNGLIIFNAEGNVTNNQITEFGFTPASVYGSGIAGWEPSGTLTFSGNTIRGAEGVGTGSAGIDFSDTGGKQVRIQNNTLEDLGYGVVAYSFFDSVGLDPAPRIQGNVFSNIVETGVFLDPELTFVGGPFKTTARFDQDGSQFADFLAGSDGNDNFEGLAGDDELLGRGGDDRLLGGAGDDEINGGTGVDSLEGGDGKDTLIGGAGNDRVLGNNGNDTLADGAGDDRYTGGGGADTFDFDALSGNDFVVDFNSGGVSDILNFGYVTKNGVVITDLDTNNDGKITGADGDGPNDFVSLKGGSLVFDFDQGDVTLFGVKSIATSQTAITFGKVDPMASDDRNNDGVDEQMFFGEGNSNDFYNLVRNEKEGVELALKAKEFGSGGGDYGAANRFYDSDGVLNYAVSTGASPSNANRADWSIDYAATVLAQGADETWSFKLLIDLDETDGVDLVDIGLTTFGGQKQGSSNYGFGFIRNNIDIDDATPGIQPYSFGPGEFDIVLEAYANGVLVASNRIIVNVEAPPAPAAAMVTFGDMPLM